MANNYYIDRKLYNIHRYDFLKLVQLGEIKDKTLICNETVTSFSEIKNKGKVDKKGECQLFNQTLLEYKELEDNESCFEKIFINISFENFIKYKCANLPGKLTEVLQAIENGITLKIDNNEILFKDFYKSNSMSKNACLYYINEKYFDRVTPRVSFGFDTGKLVLPKWYAYSGLSLSDAIILDGLHVKEGEILVVPDSVQSVFCDCITGVSVTYLLERVKDFKENLVKLISGLDDEITLESLLLESEERASTIGKVKTFISEFKSFYKSPDLKRIATDDSKNYFINFNRKHIVSIINAINESLGSKVRHILDVCSAIVKQYIDYDAQLNEYLLANNTTPTSEVFWEKFYVKNYPSEINKFDGEGLMSNDFRLEVYDQLKTRFKSFEESPLDDDTLASSLECDNVDVKKQRFFSLQIRLPYIKGVLHCVDLQQFFDDKKIKYLYGLTYNQSGKAKLKKYDPKKVKIIITNSQFKAASFLKNSTLYDNGDSKFDSFIRKMNEYNYSFGIAGFPTLSWESANLNYQFLSTIPFTESSANEIYNYNKDIVADKLSDENIAHNLISNKKSSFAEDSIFIKFPEFYTGTKRFTERKKDYLTSMKRNLLRMKLATEGYRKYLCGDLLELLYYSCYHQEEFNPMFEYLEKFEFFAPNTKLDKYYSKYLVLRNPHYSRNEIAVMKKFDSSKSEHEKYFGHLNGVVMINPLSFVADRLGGADYDGDTVVILNDKNRKKYIDKLSMNDSSDYPIVKIPSLLANSVVYNFENKSRCLENTFNSRVGIISNYAFHSAVDNYDSHKVDPDLQETPFFTILSGLEIDSAKKGVKPFLSRRTETALSSLFLNLKNKLDCQKKFSEKDIEDVTKYSTEHPIFYLENNILNLDDKLDLPQNSSIKLNYNSQKVDSDSVDKYIAINFVFNKLCKRIRSTKSNSVSAADEGIIANIRNILINKGIDNINFLNEFNILNAYNALGTYCFGDIKFHYLKDKVDKLSYIYDTLGFEQLSEETEDIICDFSNGGCYLLYFILQHLKLISLAEHNSTSELIDIDTSKLTKDDYSSIVNKKLFKTMNEEEVSIINDYVSSLTNEINKATSNISSSEEAEKIAYNILMKMANNLFFDNYLYVRGNADAGVVFSIFSKNLYEFLLENAGDVQHA